jgi:hypothetical protein
VAAAVNKSNVTDQIQLTGNLTIWNTDKAETVQKDKT